MNEQDILNIIKEDTWMMQVLTAARTLGLPNWMIGAGFVRNKIWDHLHGFKNDEVPTDDIDLIYFDTEDLEEEQEKRYDAELKNILDINWSTKNQARMHQAHGRERQYKNSEEALSEWVEVPTCTAVRLEDDDTLHLIAPHGINDLVNLVVRPTPVFLNDLDTYWGRVKSKKWEKIWPKLTCLEK